MKIDPRANTVHLVVSLQSQNDMKYTSNGFIQNKNIYLTLITTFLQTEEKIDIESLPISEVFPYNISNMVAGVQRSLHLFRAYKCILGSMKLEESHIHHLTL